MKPIRILLVEHNDDLRMQLSTYLNKRLDFSIIEVVSNGSDAIHSLDKKRFDIIITCLLMPIMDGFMMLEKIQKMHLNPRPKIVILTSLSNHTFKDRAYKLDACNYLVKPINPELICSCIANCFNETCYRNECSF